MTAGQTATAAISPFFRKRKRVITDDASKDTQKDITNAEDQHPLAQYKVKLPHYGSAYYLPTFIPKSDTRELYKRLSELEEWYRPTLKVHGRSVQQSRTICAFSPSDATEIKYSGTTVPVHSGYPPVVEEIAAKVREKLGDQGIFDYVMLNWYQNGTIRIGSHSDNLDNLVIATVSIGPAERTFILRYVGKRGERAALAQSNKDNIAWKERLKDGSLLVMQDQLQVYYKHEIPEEKHVGNQGRISLTFRKLEKT